MQHRLFAAVGESALSHAHEGTQPILITHGTADPTVAFNESLEFYNALRFNGKATLTNRKPEDGRGVRSP